MEDEDMVKSNADFLLTETTVDPKLPVEKVVAWLRSRRVTGTLRFDLSQGGVQQVSLVEKTKASLEQRRKVREILGV